MRRRYGLARYLLDAGAARTGDEMSGPALLLAGTATTGSGPLLLAALTASAALGGPVLGALLDRTPHPGRLLGGALATYATTLLLVRWTLGTLPFPAVLSLALTAGLFAPALAAGWTSRLPAITEHLPRAGALDAASYEFAALAGPALAGAVALTAGPDAALLTAVALIACALPAAWSLPGGGAGVSEEARSSGRGARGTGGAGAGAGAGGRQRPGQGVERKSAGGGGVPSCGGMAEVPEPGGGMAGVSEEEARSFGRGVRGTGGGGAVGRQRPGEGAERKLAGGGGIPQCGGMAGLPEAARSFGRGVRGTGGVGAGGWQQPGEGAEKKSAGGAGVSPCGGMAGVSEVARSLGPGASGIGGEGVEPGGGVGGWQQPGEGAEKKPAGGAGVPPYGGVTGVTEPCGGMAGVSEPCGDAARVSEPCGGMAGVSEPGGGMAGLPESRGSMVGVPKPGGGVTSVSGGLPAAMSGRALVPGPREASGPAPATRTGLLPDLRAGFRALLRIRPLARATLTSTLSHAGLGAFTAVTPFLGVQAFGAESAGAFLLAVLAFASLLASLALARRPGVLSPDALLLASTVLIGSAFLLAVVDPLAASVLAGLGAGPQLVAVFAIRHREAPERLRGQVFSTGASLKISGYAVGAGVAAVCPPGEALVAAAGFQALAVAGFLVLSRTGDQLLSRTGDRPKSAAGTCG
ncbi:MFS transporter [Streptomyces acidiscabies]|uniref:MFS transporter n=1 Tax=Streptomyces acidiscabies TaxID=42234 RepID=UPI00117CE328|nr:MFS transporter [Streptomyces acidiscabies]